MLYEPTTQPNAAIAAISGGLPAAFTMIPTGGLCVGRISAMPEAALAG